MADAPANQTPAGAAGTWQDPHRAWLFRIDMGQTQLHFFECSGFAARMTDIAYREAGASQTTHRIPGPMQCADLILRYGITNSREIENWCSEITKGRIRRRNLSIILLDSTGANDVARWDLVQAWPKKWSMGRLDANGGEIAIGELTLAFESFERVS
jgi:phage tail-like protein